MDSNLITGSCGNNMIFRLCDGVLRNEGSGSLEGHAQWKQYIRQIEHVRISPGCTAIGEGAFMNHTVLQSVHLPDTLLTIGAEAFQNCKKPGAGRDSARCGPNWNGRILGLQKAR